MNKDWKGQRERGSNTMLRLIRWIALHLAHPEVLPTDRRRS